ncbi:zinc-binding dehydrogenase [Micromonospora sp. NPDC048830]|uniref:zinc-dependent alcohol dehydrogenase n=1 Tax=Micromonospora sp. NPDC048830 TaxID=3364257 RepID=UPI00372050EE
MQAIIVRKMAGETTFGIEDWPEPQPGAEELLIEPEFVGICGSDLELLAGHFDVKMPVDYPVVLGHEWAGRVVGVGGDVVEFAPGDLVIGHGVLGSMQWFGLTSARGAAADRFTVSSSVCFRVPTGVSAQRAAMIEPTACALEGLRRAGGIDAGHTAVVFGCGTLGLAMIGVLNASGALVVAIDPSEHRRNLAVKVGAAAALAPHDADKLRADIHDAVDFNGVDFIVEASGNARAQAATFGLTNRASRILFMGLSHDAAQDVPLRFIHERDLRIFSSNGAPPEIWEPALRFVQRTGLDLTPGVSHVFDFPDVRAAIDTARSPGVAGKVMLRPASIHQ